MSEIQFEPWPKIARLNRDVIVTEKIDGTNAAILITPDAVLAQSRTRFITPEQDNYGFARWVHENADALREQLGEGRHFGEWWGAGIQRRYGLSEKRFSLFNTHRWTADKENGFRCIEAPLCHVVPIVGIARSLNDIGIENMLDWLSENGSMAAPGFMQPEGIVLFHGHSNQMYKVTFEHDDKGKEHGA